MKPVTKNTGTYNPRLKLKKICCLILYIYYLWHCAYFDFYRYYWFVWKSAIKVGTIIQCSLIFLSITEEPSCVTTANNEVIRSETSTAYFWSSRISLKVANWLHRHRNNLYLVLEEKSRVACTKCHGRNFKYELHFYF